MNFRIHILRYEKIYVICSTSNYRIVFVFKVMVGERRYQDAGDQHL